MELQGAEPPGIPVPPEEPEEPPQRRLYFTNEVVEWQLTQYLWSGCTDVVQRNLIMSHATELIRQIIRKQGLHTIYPGQEESSFGDLVNVAWCVTPDTLVPTAGGLRALDEVLPPGPEGECSIPVYGHHGLHRAEYYVRRPPTRTHRVILKHDYQAEMTGEHPLWVLTENGPDWVPAHQLVPGDLVAVQAGQQLFGSDDVIEHRPESWVAREWWPEQFTEDLAYIIGLIIAEGSIEPNRVIIYNYDREVIDYLSQSPAGLEFSYEGNGRNTCNRTRLVQLLSWLGLPPGTTCYTKQIPLRMLRCSRPIITSLLQGMFDGNGHSSRYNGEVGYSSSSVHLIDRLRIVLLNYGIYCRTHATQRGEVLDPKGRMHVPATAYQLCLPTLESARFYKQIGFRIGYKQEKSASLTTKGWHLTDPITSDRLRTLVTSMSSLELRGYGLRKQNLLKKKQFTEHTLQRVVSRFGLSDEFLQQRVSEQTGQVRVWWLPVRTIERGWSDTVDVRVRDAHSFTANGLVTHNCQVERILYKYRARPHCRKCFNPDRPADSALYTPAVNEYGIKSIPELTELGVSGCASCGSLLTLAPLVEPKQGRYGGTDTVLYRGISKVFNLWSQVSRTVILAYVKKEGRDRKNSNSYTTHLDNKSKPLSDIMHRFLVEARLVCCFNEQHLKVLDSLEYLLYTDEKPHDGTIAKLVEHSGVPRPVVTGMMKLIRLRSIDFTDSPQNRELDPGRSERRRITHAEYDGED